MYNRSCTAGTYVYLEKRFSYFYAPFRKPGKAYNITTVSNRIIRRNGNIILVKCVFGGIGTQLLTIRSSPVRQQVYSWFDYLLFMGVTH